MFRSSRVAAGLPRRRSSEALEHGRGASRKGKIGGAVLATLTVALSLVLTVATPALAYTKNTGSGTCGSTLVHIESETTGYSNQRAYLIDGRVILYEKGYRSYANRYAETTTSWATLSGATAYGSEWAYFVRLSCD